VSEKSSRNDVQPEEEGRYIWSNAGRILYGVTGSLRGVSRFVSYADFPRYFREVAPHLIDKDFVGGMLKRDSVEQKKASLPFWVQFFCSPVLFPSVDVSGNGKLIRICLGEAPAKKTGIPPRRNGSLKSAKLSCPELFMTFVLLD